MVPVHVPSTSSASASVFTHFASAAAAFSFFAYASASSFSACAADFFVAAVLLTFSMISWYLYSSPGFSTSMFFSVRSVPSCFFFKYRVFLLESCNGYSFQAW